MRHGSWKLLFLSRLLLVSYANDNIMARDYFLYKDVSNVVGFSCGGLESNVKFARTFNEVFVLTSMCNLGSVNGSSIRIFKKLLQNNYRNLGVYVDARCEGHNYTVIYYEATKSFLFDETHKWLILGRKLDDTLSLLNDDSFGVVTDITIAIETDTGFDLYDVYNPCKARGGSLNVTVLGYWTEKSGVAIRLKQPKYERRFNLHGMKLRVGVLLPRKFYNLSTEAIVLDQDMKAKYGRSQFLYTILLHMADLFNFTMEIVEVDPRKRQDNSAPMFVAFQKKTVDISASPIVMKADRLRSGDIIGPVWPMRSCFLFRTISSANMKTKQFLKPLNIKVWYVVLCTIIISAFILAILIRQEGIHSVSEGYNICILLTIGAISQQGSVFVPVHYAGRIAFIHIMLFSVLILNYYSASIVSDRLKNMSVKMNDSLISLADSQLKVAAEPTPYIRSFLQRSHFIQNIKFLFFITLAHLLFHLFVETSKYRMYDYSYHWLVLGSTLNSSVPLLNDNAYSMTTDFTLAITNGSGYDLYDVYNHCKYRGGTLNLTRLGWWRRGEGLIITLTQPLVERRANMHGMTLKISGVFYKKKKEKRLIIFYNIFIVCFIKLNSESNYFRKKRWDPLPESKRYLPLEEGMKQVSEGILAYHTDPNTAYPYIEKMFDPNKICALTEIHLFKQSVMGMYASRNGQFTEMAKIGLSKMFNTGLRDRQIKYWSSRKPQCTLDTLSTRSISIYEIAPALILLAFGVLVGGIICFIENIIYYRFMREETPRPLSSDDAEATASTSKHNLSE
ncbi:hypothetical protein ALC57_09398 [Trachymyrmex cornetzi]|uniref:Ionotropic receptor 75a N-terminal domain-containing protein n=1 Tax=Trachymyrmex cornetzi TaxID=471704 RepID=A0A195DZN2_9HYME|nr:hypothetical protein ALC57_09398 [Trachymyrmex cornetzi]